MPINIPITPATANISPVATSAAPAAPVSTAMATATGALGSALEKTGGAGYDAEAQEVARQAEASRQVDASWTAKTITNSTLGLIQQNQDLQAKAIPGSPEFDKYQSDLTEALKTSRGAAIEAAPTQLAKNMVDAHFNQLTLQMGEQGAQWHRAQFNAYNAGNISQSVDQAIAVAIKDPSQGASQYAMISNLAKTFGGTEEQRIALRAKVDAMPETVVKALVELDPKGVYDTIWKHFFPEGSVPAAGTKADKMGVGQSSIADLRQTAAVDETTWDKREDGSAKGHGYLGLLKAPSGKVMSEYSVGIEIDGKETDIPTFVPTLTRAEVLENIKNADEGKMPSAAIMNKAEAWAKKRIADGKPVFAQEGEQTDIQGARSGAASFAPPKKINAAVEQFGKTIDANAQRFGVDPNIMRAQIDAESSGNPHAVGPETPTGHRSIGLTQFQPATAERFGIDPTVPEQAIEGQAHYMSVLLNQFGGDYQKALAGYNAGEGNVEKAVAQFGDKWLKNLGAITGAKHAAETQGYVAKIMGNVAGGPDHPSESPAQSAAIRNSIAAGTAPGGTGSTGNAMIDALKPAQALAIMQFAEGRINQKKAQGQAEFQANLADASAVAVTGQDFPTAPTHADFQKYYPGTLGDRMEGAYLDKVTFGKNMSQMKDMSTQQMDEAVEASRPTPGVGFAEREKLYAVAQQAADQIKKKRIEDSVGFALQAQRPGYTPIEPATLNDPAKLTAAIQMRFANKDALTRDYGVESGMLSKPEAEGLTKALKSMPTETKKVIFGALFNGTGAGATLDSITAFKQIAQQIAKDDPVAASAGMDYARHHMYAPGDSMPNIDVADLVLRGDALLHPNRKTDGDNHEGGKALIQMPKEAEMRAAFDRSVGAAFVGDAETSDLYYQRTLAIYAARTDVSEKRTGNEIDPTRWNTSVQLATGGIQKYQGKEIILPWGWSADKFANQVEPRMAQLPPNAIDLKPAEMAGLPLKQVGDGSYVIQYGTKYLTDKATGRPLVLNFNTAAPAAPVAHAAPQPMGRRAADAGHVGVGTTMTPPSLAATGGGPAAMAADPNNPQPPAVTDPTGAAAWHAGQQAREGGMQ